MISSPPNLPFLRTKSERSLPSLLADWEGTTIQLLVSHFSSARIPQREKLNFINVGQAFLDQSDNRLYLKIQTHDHGLMF